ncbi:MAG: F0F1 ATP synthase subunit A [Parcubacteria group bacterium]|nr:F0F1 ATP synthase subunit A [Parcubacteria group bacterium]
MEFHIPTLAPDVVGHIAGLPVTNTIINAWLAIAIFLLMGIFIRLRLSLRPAGLQNAMEFFLETMLGYFDQVTGDRKKTLKFLPIVGGVFFFILLSNWLTLLPGTGSLTWNHTFVLRPATTDLNLTAAMALSAVILSHVYGLITVGVFTHVGKFIQIGNVIKSLRRGPIAIFTAVVELGVGFIEVVTELAKVLSLSFRLFGNIFAGEVLLSVMSSLAGLLVPAPFMLLELLVGIIQAGVFAMLTLLYLSVSTTVPVHEEAHSSSQNLN